MFDVVYSWGVLHHTGNLDLAMEKAAALVKPDGLFVVALYRRTWLDPLWRVEKKWYTGASPKAQRRAQKIYDLGFRAAQLVVGKRGTDGQRGMEYWHDMHDWLGGYPYEAMLAPEVDDFCTQRGFTKERVFARGRPLGIFGSGCDEYVYRAKQAES